MADEQRAQVAEDDFEARCARVRLVLRAAARIADPHDELGREARRLLPAQTGLSPAGVELGLRRHMETSAPDGLIHSLVRCVPQAARVHVVLSANVFVGAVRALGLAVASAPEVFVRASRREPVTASLLVRALRDLSLSPPVRMVERIEPLPGDVVHAYGRRASLDAISRSLPRGVSFWAHGPGMGIVLAGEAQASVDAHERLGDRESEDDVAERLSWDVIAFDQRGCLSPRLVLWMGSQERAYAFAALIAEALARREIEVPRGVLDSDDAAQAALYVRSMQMVGRCWSTDRFAVGVEAGPLGPTVPPVGRHVHIACVSATASLPGWVAGMAPFVTTVGLSMSMRVPALEARAKEVLGSMPGARVAELGRMQQPPFDGPVDRRCLPERSNSSGSAPCQQSG